MDRRALGSWGEARAARYLRLRAYRVLAMNYRCRLGEIDLIARRGRYIVFVEVKLRRDGRFAEAREFVTRAKQERIMATAQLWMQENETELQPRFDVIEIYAPEGENGPVRINHIENAFM
jgi:putative endonuclease